MPDHVHVVVQFTLRSATLGSFVGAWKAATTKRVREELEPRRGDFFQRGFYDHVIRDESDLHFERWYADTNPQRWLFRYGRSTGRAVPVDDHVPRAT